MTSDSVHDKDGTKISVGDTVYTKFRGGKREGEVEKIVTTDKTAARENVKNPPKVIFEDQHGHRVAHNPETLTNIERKM